MTIAEAIIKRSCAILASSVAVWEPGLYYSVSPPEEPLMWSWLCLRFLAKAMIKRAYHCSFGLSKTLDRVSSD